MTTEASQNLQVSEYVYTPPDLPAHLSSLYNLKPVVGQPSAEEVKAIHAVIKTVDAGVRIPELYGPDLSLQLSEHLFNIQMAVYRNKYPMNIFPGENTYTPPSLPTYIPIQLEPVVGIPSKDQLKVVQNAMKTVESLGSGPLFDPDLNMELSQHLFNLQFARYIQDSNLGQFVPRPAESRRVPPATRAQQAHPPETHTNLNTDAQSAPIRPDTPEPTASQHPTSEPIYPPYDTPSEVVPQGEAMKDVKELLSGSKEVLENINRVLIALQRNQVTVGEWDHWNIAHLNPVSARGMSASECGLPRLRFRYYQHICIPFMVLSLTQLAEYLKFLDIGGDLIEGDEFPSLKGGEAGRKVAMALIFRHIGYSI